MKRNRVVITALDTIAEKNLYQLELLNRDGYKFDIFTIDRRGRSRQLLKSIGGKNNLYIVQSGIYGFFERSFKFLNYLLDYRKSIHHVEIYPESYFAVFYFLLTKVFGLPVIAVERGILKEHGYSKWHIKLASIFCFRSADVVWIREPFIEQELRSIGVENIHYIHNSISISKEEKNNNTYNNSFLWFNSMASIRKPELVLQSSAEIAKDYPHVFTMVGFQSLPNYESKYLTKELLKKEEEVLKNRDTFQKILPFGYNFTTFHEHQFFILIADRVFLNNSLLEAMSVGLIPIISNTEHSSLIVDHGDNGFICDNQVESIKAIMIHAMNLSLSERTLLSKNVKKKVKKDFNSQKWADKMNQLYSLV